MDKDKPTAPWGVEIDARLVPFPNSISPQARASLAFYVGDDNRLPVRPPYPPACNTVAWAAWREVALGRNLEALRRRCGIGKATNRTEEIAGVVVHVATPEHLLAEDRIYLNLHGGALIVGGGDYCLEEGRLLADLHGVAVYSIDYRLAPEHPYPAALDDCLAVYRALLARVRPEAIVVGGVSAGGNLVAALALRARDEGLPFPGALVLITPELDLTESGDSFQVNRGSDVVLGGGLSAVNALYVGAHDPTHPYLSPLFGDFTAGFPPTFLQAGTRDLFLSNAVRMHRTLRQAGVPAELHVFEAMPHGGFRGSPEDEDLAQETRRFVRGIWALGGI